MTEVDMIDEFTVDVHSWDAKNSVPNADSVLGHNYKALIRKTGKGRNALYERQVVRNVNVPNGALVEVISTLLAESNDMVDVTVRTTNTAVGGGHGHYDYAV